MRIIAGTYRRFHLRSLKGADLRPTSDQMRQTLFDVLGPAVKGSRFLDAYAGSGAVGLEAYSRGARAVVLIENHRAAVELIERNLTALAASSEAVRVLACRVATGLERLAREAAEFEYVFLDPPYADVAEYHRVLRSLSRSPLVALESAIIAEHSRHMHLEANYGRLEQVRLLRHGDSQLAFYRLRPGDG
jgi:16S rRNA (guanine966-N2)-methyltransferase